MTLYQPVYINQLIWLFWFKFHQVSKARDEQCSGLLIIKPKNLVDKRITTQIIKRKTREEIPLERNDNDENSAGSQLMKH